MAPLSTCVTVKKHPIGDAHQRVAALFICGARLSQGPLGHYILDDNERRFTWHRFPPASPPR